MAYSATVATSGKGVLDALGAFMVANGWTLHDNAIPTTNPVDKVYKSTGISGKQNHYVRLSLVTKELEFAVVSLVFTVGETVTGALSGATGVVLDNTGGVLTIYDDTGIFRTGETITGSTSLATGTVSHLLRPTLQRDPRAHESCVDHVITRSYTFWDAAAHIGVNETAQWGPWHVVSPGNSGFGPHGGYDCAFGQAVRARVGSVSPPFLLDRPIGGASWSTWNGHRRLYGIPGVPGLVFYLSDTGDGGPSFGGNAGSFRFIDFPSWRLNAAPLPFSTTAPNNPPFSSVGPTPVPAGPWVGGTGPTVGGNGGIVVWDRSMDREYVYCFGNSTVLAQQWKRWNTDLNSWEDLAAPPWAAAASGHARLCWDGGDFIYAGSGATTTFGRYQISTNTWTTLTAAPAAPTAFASPFASYNDGIYCPKGTIPGVTEDVIYWLWDNAAVATTGLRRYNVTSNTWQGNGDILFPENGTPNSSSFWWDYNRYIHYVPLQTGSTGNTYAYRLDLQNISRGWVSFALTTVPQGVSCGVRTVNPYVGKIRVRNGVSVNCWFIGDADHVKVVTKIGSNYYWSYIGLTDTHLKNVIATTTAVAAVGSSTNVAVDSSAGFVVGDAVLTQDRTTGAVHPTAISAVPDGTHITIGVQGTPLPVGSQIFVDGVHTFLGNDSWLGAFGFDVGGFEPDGQSSCYRLAPLAEPAFSQREGPSVRGRIGLCPYVIYASQSQFKTFENRASLKGVFAVHQGSSPSPQPESVVQQNDGSQYILFPVKSTERTQDDRLIAVGPIN